MIYPLIAVDLGARPAMVLATGTDQCPVLLAARRFSRWDPEEVVGQIKEWVALHPGAVLYCEETFTERRQGRHRVKFDVGRK